MKCTVTEKCTVTDAARVTGVSVSKINRHIKKGALPSEKLRNGKRIVNLPDVWNLSRAKNRGSGINEELDFEENIEAAEQKSEELHRLMQRTVELEAVIRNYELEVLKYQEHKNALHEQNTALQKNNLALEESLRLKVKDISQLHKENKLLRVAVSQKNEVNADIQANDKVGATSSNGDVDYLHSLNQLWVLVFIIVVMLFFWVSDIGLEKECLVRSRLALHSYVNATRYHVTTP